MASKNMYDMIKPEGSRKKDNIKKVSKKLIIIIMCIISIVVLGLVYWFFFIKPSLDNARESKAISNIINEVVITKDEINTDKTDMQLKVQELRKTYSNIVGWIKIDDTNIDYPVLQTSDNNYYLTHNYKGEYSKLGSIFMNKSVDVSRPSNNFVIYGHNITTGVMFNELLNYQKWNYYNSHRIIHFTTVNSDKDYEIISAFKSTVFSKNDTNVFKYYQFINTDSQEEYMKFIRQAKESSVYDTGITSEYGKQLITLITCEYTNTNGRMVIIAREK